MGLDWKPIIKAAKKAAEDLGHKLGKFGRSKQGIFGGNTVRMVSCETCYGCGWIAHTDRRGYGAGGRILNYRCGTAAVPRSSNARELGAKRADGDGLSVPPVVPLQSSPLKQGRRATLSERPTRYQVATQHGDAVAVPPNP